MSLPRPPKKPEPPVHPPHPDFPGHPAQTNPRHSLTSPTSQPVRSDYPSDGIVPGAATASAIPRRHQPATRRGQGSTMTLDLFTEPATYMSLLTLTAMEVVLGIDNVIFISILSGKLPAAQQPSARRLGLSLALVLRLALLFTKSARGPRGPRPSGSSLRRFSRSTSCSRSTPSSPRSGWRGTSR